MVEQQFCKLQVAGSIPATGTNRTKENLVPDTDKKEGFEKPLTLDLFSGEYVTATALVVDSLYLFTNHGRTIRVRTHQTLGVLPSSVEVIETPD